GTTGLLVELFNVGVRHGGIVLGYKKKQKMVARQLRSDMTEAEQLLWSKLRRKQLGGLQFYQQNTLEGYELDMYCHSEKLVMELDGSQHYEPEQQEYDKQRTMLLNAMGLNVIRFPNDQVLRETEGVVAEIYRVACGKSPLAPL